MMDDHILDTPVDEGRLVELLNLMRNNHSPHTVAAILPPSL